MERDENPCTRAITRRGPIGGRPRGPRPAGHAELPPGPPVRWRSHFETGTSNGGLTAHPGGDRWSWERRIFGGAYDDAPAGQRPKYGALDFRRRGTGGSPRFGSAHLRLRAHTLGRTTFCYPDSVLEPTLFGVAARMSLVEHAEGDEQDSLDDYIEAQIHGPLRISLDVEVVVLDPCFRGTDVELAAARMPRPVDWHGGFRLAVTELRRHPNYRGQRYVDLGCALARDGHLDPGIVGDAVRSGRHDEQSLQTRVAPSRPVRRPVGTTRLPGLWHPAGTLVAS